MCDYTTYIYNSDSIKFHRSFDIAPDNLENLTEEFQEEFTDMMCDFKSDGVGDDTIKILAKSLFDRLQIKGNICIKDEDELPIKYTYYYINDEGEIDDESVLQMDKSLQELFAEPDEPDEIECDDYQYAGRTYIVHPETRQILDVIDGEIVEIGEWDDEAGIPILKQGMDSEIGRRGQGN